MASSTNIFQVTNLPIATGNFMPGRQGNQITNIFYHTMVGTIGSANARFNNPAAQVSAHYGLSIVELAKWVNENDTAYHCGNWQYNLRSIGIEHEDNGNYNDPRPELLYQRSAAITVDICKRYGLSINRDTCKEHREVYPTACPDALDTDKIVRMAQAMADNGTDIATLLKSDANEIVTLSSVALDQIDTITDEHLKNSLGFDIAEIKRKMGAVENRYTVNQH